MARQEPVCGRRGPAVQIRALRPAPGFKKGSNHRSRDRWLSTFSARLVLAGAHNATGRYGAVFWQSAPKSGGIPRLCASAPGLQAHRESLPCRPSAIRGSHAPRWSHAACQAERAREEWRAAAPRTGLAPQRRPGMRAEACAALDDRLPQPLDAPGLSRQHEAGDAGASARPVRRSPDG